MLACDSYFKVFILILAVSVAEARSLRSHHNTSKGNRLGARLATLRHISFLSHIQSLRDLSAHWSAVDLIDLGDVLRGTSTPILVIQSPASALDVGRSLPSPADWSVRGRPSFHSPQSLDTRAPYTRRG